MSARKHWKKSFKWSKAFITYDWFKQYKIKQDEKVSLLYKDLHKQTETVSLIKADLQASTEEKSALLADLKNKNEEIEMHEKSTYLLKKELKSSKKTIAKQNKKYGKRMIELQKRHTAKNEEIKDLKIKRNDYYKESIDTETSLLWADRAMQYAWRQQMDIAEQARAEDMTEEELRKAQLDLLVSIKKKYPDPRLNHAFQEITDYTTMRHKMAKLRQYQAELSESE